MKLCNKARKIIGVFYRRFYRNSSSSTLLKLYLSHIRPHLEYCSAVWNPHLKGDITELEKVQKYALKVCMKSWDTSYEDLLATSNVPSLEFRRKYNSVCHLFKIFKGLTDYPSPPITLQNFHYNVRSAGSNVLTIPKFRTCTYQHSFFPSTIAKWNMLSKETRECKSLGSFKCLLRNF